MQSTSRLSIRSEKPESNTTPVVYDARPQWRFRTLVIIFGFLGVIIFAQLVRYQVFRRSEVSPAVQQAQDPSPRGIVVDRNGAPLVVNRYFFRVSATPREIQVEEVRQEIASQLSALIGLPYEDTLSLLTIYADQAYVVLADAITLEDAQRIIDYQEQEETVRGVYPLQYVQVHPMTRRYYPQSELTSHITGFVQQDFGGVTGLEEYYNEFLWQDGIGLLSNSYVSADTLPKSLQKFVPSAVGKDLILTLDSNIQWILHEELQRGLAQFRARSGSVIAMEPDSGAILGMVSLPDYDPNRFETSEFGRFVNPTISAQYEPGSIYKIITMAAGLDTGAITPSTIYTDTGSFTIGERVIFNSNRMAHGQVSTSDALAQSLNVVTAQIAATLGPEQFYRYVRLFGFGEATGIDLSGEIDGLIKTPRSPDWSVADLGTNSFGQGIAVTPIQMINAATAIANGGKLMRPYVVATRVEDGHVQHTEPTVVRRVMQPEYAQELTEMMVYVVENGTNRAGVPGYTVAGKSGTAQIPSPEGYVEDETIVSFVGFAPVDDPKFVLLVKMDRPDPEISPWASQTAAPVFSHIAERLLIYLDVPPDDIRLAQSGE